jgi:hypothetical protein
MRLLAAALLVISSAALAQDSAPVYSLAADEARQGIVSDGTHAYALDNNRLGKYDPKTGARLGGWEGTRAQFPHMNSCSYIDARLYCAASNYPRVPHTSQIEIFDPVKMTHLETIPLPAGIGSLTWLDRRAGVWWAGFANYDGNGGEPGRDHRLTTVVRFDAGWKPAQSWLLPQAVLDRMKPMSMSGGAWGDDGLLYATGHDHPELYALRVPAKGDRLELVATLPIPFEGQAIAFDPQDHRLLWGISRKDRRAIAVRIPAVNVPR